MIISGNQWKSHFLLIINTFIGNNADLWEINRNNAEKCYFKLKSAVFPLNIEKYTPFYGILCEINRPTHHYFVTFCRIIAVIPLNLAEIEPKLRNNCPKWAIFL